jgi:PAS domain S-box-containing protein
MALSKISLPKKIIDHILPFSSIKHSDNLLDSLQEVVLVLDDSGAIQYVNQCWAHLTGSNTRKSLGQLIEVFLHPEDILSWSRAFQSLASVKHQRICCRLLNETGDIHWCEIRMQLMSNNPISVSVTLSDVTSHVHEDNIRQADYRSLTAMINRLPLIVYRARNNKNWSMEYISDGCVELTGYCPQKLVNNAQLSFASLIHPEDSIAVWESVQNALQKRSVFNLNYRLIHADGNIISVTERGQGLYASTDVILGVEGVIFKQQ